MVNIMMKQKIHKESGEEYLLCPRCRIDMEKLMKRGVVIDVCKKCGGMWVDAGEMEKLAKIKHEEERK
jgi:Zn-finger nucleic acid-binding protein